MTEKKIYNATLFNVKENIKKKNSADNKYQCY